MKKKRILMSAAVVCVILLMAAGIVYAVRKSQEKTVMVIPAGSINYGGGFFDTSVTTDGIVTADVSQDIYITSTQTVDEVFVSEGQRVYVGDKLLSYDTMKTGMNLEKQKISKEQIELKMEVARRNLVTLKRLKPVSSEIAPTEEPSDPGETWDPEEESPSWDEPSFDEEEPHPTSTPTAAPTPSYGEADVHKVLNATVRPFNEAEKDAGTRENPFRVLCADGTEIRSSFIDFMREMAEKKGGDVYFSLEIYEGDRADGRLLAAWIINAAFLGRVDEDWFRYLYLYPVSPEPGKEPTGVPGGDMPYITAAPSPIPTATPKAEQEEDAPSDVGQPSLTPEPSMTGQPEPTVTDAPYGAFDSDSDDRKESDAPRVTAPQGSGSLEGTMSSSHGGYMPAMSSEAMIVAVSDFGYVYLANEEKPESENAIAGALGLIESGAKMTKEEIADRKKEEEAELESLRLDLRECLLDIKAAEAAVRDGTVLSRMNGIVKKVGDKDHPDNDGSPFLTVSSEDGLYVKAHLSERMYGKVKVGDPVDIMAWESGMSFKGKVRDISIYPETMQSGGFDADGSQYPMTISFAAGSGEIKNGEWVMVTLSPSGEGEDMSVAESMGMMYLYAPFIREEDGKMYVMKRGEDSRLMKQYIEVGKMSGEGYEILSGVTTDDYLAFPYGKEVKEGAKTREGTIDELYTS